MHRNISDRFTVILDADEFLSNTYELYELDAIAVIKGMRKHYNNPSFTANEFITDLRRHGLQRLATHIARAIDLI